jgi:hypothetical protein
MQRVSKQDRVCSSANDVISLTTVWPLLLVTTSKVSPRILPLLNLPGWYHRSQQKRVCLFVVALVVSAATKKTHCVSAAHHLPIIPSTILWIVSSPWRICTRSYCMLFYCHTFNPSLYYSLCRIVPQRVFNFLARPHDVVPCQQRSQQHV